jgi:hypothetical protein
MESNWELTKQKSQYHFDPTIIDPRWDSVTRLGNFIPNWATELEEIIQSSRPATWATRAEFVRPLEARKGNKELQKEEYDLLQSGLSADHQISHLSWHVPPLFQKMSDLFGMEDTWNRMHIQKTGELWNLHIDKLEKACPEDPSRVLRVFVQLTDWQPGQFWQYGNYNYCQWRAGDITTFDWQNVPHCTANAGYHPRVTFQITGLITDKTREFLQVLNAGSYQVDQ